MPSKYLLGDYATPGGTADAGDAGDPDEMGPCRSRRSSSKGPRSPRRSRSRPTNGASSPGRLRLYHRGTDTTRRRAPQSNDGLVLALRARGQSFILVHHRLLGRPPRRVSNKHGFRDQRPTGYAPRCRRDGRRPCPCPSAPIDTAASPVGCTPARARNSGAPTSSPSAETAATRSSAARTARSPSSLRCGRRFPPPPSGHSR